MNNISLINTYIEYKIKYFEYFSQFINRYNIINNNFLSVFCCKIRSENAQFDEYYLFLNSGDIHCKNLDIIVPKKPCHDINYYNYSISGYKLYFLTLERNQNDGAIVLKSWFYWT